MTKRIMERIDYLDVAQQFVKKYKLKSKVVFVNTKDYGDYVVETDEIQLRRSYPSVKEFLMTVLHEIHCNYLYKDTKKESENVQPTQVRFI